MNTGDDGTRGSNTSPSYEPFVFPCSLNNALECSLQKSRDLVKVPKFPLECGTFFGFVRGLWMIKEKKKRKKVSLHSLVQSWKVAVVDSKPN